MDQPPSARPPFVINDAAKLGDEAAIKELFQSPSSDGRRTDFYKVDMGGYEMEFRFLKKAADKNGAEIELSGKQLELPANKKSLVLATE